MKDVYEQGGINAFFKGALPRALKSALNIALQFFLYDSLKRIANVAPDDLKVGYGGTTMAQVHAVNMSSNQLKRSKWMIHSRYVVGSSTLVRRRVYTWNVDVYT